LTAAVFRIEERQRSQKISKLDRILRREKINTSCPKILVFSGKLSLANNRYYPGPRVCEST
jgi:hypothetical protein